MTLRTPPSWLQNGLHPAENDRLSMQALWATTGVIGTNSLPVTADSPASMNVIVGTGWCAIVGNYQPNMGVYTVYNDASVTLPISTADPTNPRIDRVVVTIQDSYYTGSADDVIFQVVQGTPAGSPVAPATPTNSLSLATVAVGAAVTQINTGNITDTRVDVTTQLPIGDITSVVAGTGLQGGGAGPGAVTLAIDSSVVTLTGSQALSNKTYSGTTFTGTTFSGTGFTQTGTNSIGSIPDMLFQIMMGAI